MLEIKNYGLNITTQELGGKIYNDIINILKEEDQVLLNFNDVMTMTTFCAKQIFGQLFNELGQEEFNKKIKFEDLNEDLQAIIIHGIENSID